MNGFDKRREKKKKQIIHALTDLIMTKNLKEIGVREIAEHANVSPASIYNFFGSKEELIKQAIYYLTEKETKKFVDLVDEDIPFKEKTNKLFSMSMAKQENMNSEGLKNIHFDDPAFQKYIKEFSEASVMPLFTKLLEQGKAEGEISHTVSNRAIMFYYNAILMLVSDPAVRNSMDVELRKEITQLFLYGIFGNETMNSEDEASK
ncbi:DNA-binding transcriptional regulator, AcrR family [Evansella caseinilytica]|uniref:DNA-binding transcriptional regulator, AcrR family n=1 Tax=Evansella caseinilytica TaxID=1503961 RepID=A0A1H3LTZ3_9BACI|nr:TetR/AcrR family transcriptional regulator [Evansella caseinilytica]SDY67559.1 DNA-binding transcriptional regulator, AcrR family [Evansella caseinilytica]